jgi:hypothetical protein
MTAPLALGQPARVIGGHYRAVTGAHGQAPSRFLASLTGRDCRWGRQTLAAVRGLPHCSTAAARGSTVTVGRPTRTTPSNACAIARLIPVGSNFEFMISCRPRLERLGASNLHFNVTSEY